MDPNRALQTLLMSIAAASLVVGSVLGLFLVEAVLLTGLGGGVGTAASLAGSPLISHALGWPLTVPLSALALAATFSVTIGLVFGIVPARRAARLDPIEVLRSE